MQRTCGTSSAALDSRLVAAGVGEVPGGFSSPAQDYSATQIDLTKLLVKHELSTFIVGVPGGSMEGAGIYDGDELIVASNPAMDMS